MKINKKILLIAFFIFFISKIFSQEKYGALAVDRNNGFYYGYAVDYNTLTEAKSRALKECKEKGGNCVVVKTWKGASCMAYRTIDGKVGTAYGWGIAKNKSEADRIALSECEKRSNGEPCSNFVWGCNSKSKEKKENDDFWSGETDKKSNENNSSKKDDFWSGGKEKTSKSNNGEFWDGKGSSKEERQFIENTQADESDKFIGNVRSRTNRIRIYCVDTGKEDGDKVRISNNGKTLKNEIYLTNNGKSYWFDLKFGQNRIEILALNQGSLGSNTAAFKIYDEKGNVIAEKDWHLKTGYKGTLLILKI